MLESAFIITSKSRFKLDSNQINNFKFIVDLATISYQQTDSFDIEFVFDNPIAQFRNHDYTWVDCKTDRIATSFSPKIIKLSNGTLVQANINLGIWEVNKNKSNVLLWRFNPVNAHPIVNYSGKKNEKVIVQANNKIVFDTKPALLFSTKSAIEFSRSQIPFSAIACFTDHCDFDTLENLKTQRIFFKNNGIKVTKGFFLNHFSKREDNASFENDSNEINEWRNDGHELAYHSLSQSIKSDEESFSDFENFTPPFSDITTWIDHGYQPYNLSLYKNNAKSDDYFFDIIKEKRITTLWNYIDSGTTTNGVINQLNPNHFNLKSFYNGSKNETFISRLGHFFKAVIFHYYSDKKTVNYIDFTVAIKNIIYKKKIKSFVPLVTNGFKLLLPFIKTVLNWNITKNETFKNAKYTPLIFTFSINNQSFLIFQTVEMIDFTTSLSKENIDILIKEKGIFIAHTYFSASMSYQKGRMLLNEKEVNPLVIDKIKFLSVMIKENKIWNPTLRELSKYVVQFQDLILDIDENQEVKIVGETDLHYQFVN